MTRPLPRQLTPLIGRSAELRQVREWLERERLVSLVGAGGIGKTRLALETVRQLDGETCFVDLAAVNGADAVVPSIAAALGIAEGGGGSVDEAIFRALGDAPILVLLDNCEHVVEACAAFVERLLSECGQARVLVTSRETLGVPGEVAWSVPSLAVPPPVSTDPGSFDAVQLFVDRARRARPHVTVTDSFLASAAEICRRVDGIALAIELAAATTRVLHPDRIVDELDHRFALLTGGPRTALSRHHTLLASVEWSHAQLTPTEQHVFRMLGVFTGAFPLEAAEAIASNEELTGWAVFDVITRLVDKSLVNQDAETGWYRLLETLRLFAVDQCNAAGELIAARDAHARWWHRWLLGLGPHWYSDLALDGVDRAYANLRVALRWLITTDPDAAHDMTDAMGTYWYMSGLFTEALALSDEVLAEAQDLRPARWARTVAAMVSVYDVTRRQELPALAQQAGAIARKIGDRLSAVRCDAADLRGRPDPGHLADLHQRATEAGDLYLVARIRHTRAGFEYLAGLAPWTWSESDLPADSALTAAVNHSWLFTARARCVNGDYRGAWVLQQEARSSNTRWTQYTLLYSLLDGVWFPLLLGDADAVAAASATAKAWRRDWGRHQPLVTLLGNLPALLDGAPPSSDVQKLWEGADTLLLSFPPWPWLFLEVLGPPKLTRSMPAGLEVASEALEAIRMFAASDDSSIEPMLARLSRLKREDQHFWLLMLACVIAAHGACDRAARVIGAVDGFQLAAGVPWVPSLLRERRNSASKVCEQRLGAEFETLLASGRTMSLDDAAAYSTRSRGKRGRPAFGWDSLTPTELLVVKHLRGGLSNPQIAAELFMSTATVKTHLTHMYSKLGVANRTELVALAATRA